MIHFVWLVAHRDSLCRTNALVWFSHNIPDVFWSRQLYGEGTIQRIWVAFTRIKSKPTYCLVSTEMSGPWRLDLHSPLLMETDGSTTTMETRLTKTARTTANNYAKKSIDVFMSKQHYTCIQERFRYTSSLFSTRLQRKTYQCGTL